MKCSCAALSILGVVLAYPGLAQQQTFPVIGHGVASGDVSPAEGTPAQQRITASRQQIKVDPRKVEAYNELCLAFLKRARETADPKYLNDADAALTAGLKIDPTDFQLLRTQVALMLARHQYLQAREQGTTLNNRTPDDVLTYGYIAEADIALGNYPQAEENAQWMLNLRSNNIPGLLIGAELRVLYGDNSGALQFLNLAYSETSPMEVEDLAWIANRIAGIEIESGQIDEAAKTLERTELIFPHYPYTMESLARVFAAEDKLTNAIELWKQAAQVDHDPHVLYELARAQDAAGKTTEAQAVYSEFEKAARAPEGGTLQSRIDLILMYAGSEAKVPDSLTLARQELTARHDVWTLDAYAWALYANAKYQEADAAEQKAIAVGIRNAQIFDHAGHIAERLIRSADAAKYFKLAVQANPTSEYASDALKSAGLTNMSASREQNGLQISGAKTAASARVTNQSPVGSDSVVAETSKRAALIPRTESDQATPVFSPVPQGLLTPRPTGTDLVIRRAQAKVARDPKDSVGYTGLGAAYFQRARETGDVADYQQAEQSLTRSLDLESAEFSAGGALETMAEVCMGEHRFGDALNYAHKALALGTGDVSPFAIIGDADADMGEYDKARTAYERLTPRDMTLSPRAAYARDSRLAYLKFIAGDTGGATALMQTSVAEGTEAQLPAENLSWLYYELGEFYMQAGDAASADKAYLTALSIHPGDYRALASLGKLRANNGRYAEAIVLYQRAIAIVPMPIFIAELGDLYAKSGNDAEARKQYELVEYIGLLGHINQVLHNRDLALFYADHDMKLAEALDLAQKELEVRHDIYTWDALAWALYKNGKLKEASEASKKAIQYGTRDSLLLFHDGMIAQALGQSDQARAALKEALQINRHFHLLYVDTAQHMLGGLGQQTESKEGSE